jgi:hypothetical protein
VHCMLVVLLPFSQQFKRPLYAFVFKARFALRLTEAFSNFIDLSGLSLVVHPKLLAFSSSPSQFDVHIIGIFF